MLQQSVTSPGNVSHVFYTEPNVNVKLFRYNQSLCQIRSQNTIKIRADTWNFKPNRFRVGKFLRLRIGIAFRRPKSFKWLTHAHQLPAIRLLDYYTVTYFIQDKTNMEKTGLFPDDAAFNTWRMRCLLLCNKNNKTAAEIYVTTRSVQFEEFDSWLWVMSVCLKNINRFFFFFSLCQYDVIRINQRFSALVWMNLYVSSCITIFLISIVWANRFPQTRLTLYLKKNTKK